MPGNMPIRPLRLRWYKSANYKELTCLLRISNSTMKVNKISNHSGTIQSCGAVPRGAGQPAGKTPVQWRARKPTPRSHSLIPAVTGCIRHTNCQNIFRLFLVPGLCLGMRVARLCLDYDSEMKPVCGQSAGMRNNLHSRMRGDNNVP